MNTANKKNLLDLIDTCIDVNCDTFTVFFELSAHVSSFTARVFPDGWYEKCEEPTYFSFNYDGDFVVDEAFNLAKKGILELKKQHDIKYTPENLAITKENNRQDEITKLKSRLVELTEIGE